MRDSSILLHFKGAHANPETVARVTAAVAGALQRPALKCSVVPIRRPLKGGES